MTQRLIVGIDPGTTTAWAILDIEGNILQIGSSKGLGLSALISIIASFGKPIIAGCDKQKTPGFVNDFARKCGSRVIAPVHDLLVEFKRGLCKDVQTANAHELDALSSARFALQHLSPLLVKIKAFQQRLAPNLPFEEIAETVLLSDISIKGAIDMLTQEERDYENTLWEKRHHHEPGIAIQTPSRPLLTLLHHSQHQVQLLLSHKEQLAKTISDQQHQIHALQEKISRPVRKHRDALLSHKESTISKMSTTLEQQRKHIQTLELTCEQLETALLTPERHVIAHNLHDLTQSSLDQFKKTHTINTSTALFVQHPDRHHPNVISHLSFIAPLILTDMQPKKHPLSVISAATIPRISLPRITLFLGSDIDRILHTTHLIHTIVKDYRNERGAPRTASLGEGNYSVD